MNTTKYEYAIMTRSSMSNMIGRERYVQICEHTFVTREAAEETLQNWPSSREKFICQRVVGQWERVQ